MKEQYKWILGLRGLPKTISIGLKYLGVQEVVGRGSSRTIISWRDQLNGAAPAGRPIVLGFSDDDIAWCGLFAAIITFLRKGNIAEVVKEPLWARNWARYGSATKEAMLGDVLVFERNEGGHVGFYIGEDKTHYHVLGGNQSNAVTIARIAKNRCIARRRPPYNTNPSAMRVYHLAAEGEISTNEA